MQEIAAQLGLDKTFFIQLAVFAGFYFILSRTFFGPAEKLIATRRKRTLEDRKAAEDLLNQAVSKLSEVEKSIAAKKVDFLKQEEALLTQAKREAGDLLAEARAESRKITLETVEAVSKERAELETRLARSNEDLAQELAKKLLRGGA